METKLIWTVSFGDNDFDDLNCAFDNFKSAKEAAQAIFAIVSARNPEWQNFKLEDEDTESEWAIYTFDYVDENAHSVENIKIIVAPIPYNSLSID